MIDWDKIEHFKPSEFSGDMDPELVELLDIARSLAEVPFVLNSTRRDGDGTSEHNTGHAVDIRCHDSRSRYRIVLGLLMAGFHRVGVYDRHVHAGTSEEHDPEVMWMGESK